MKFLHLSDLHIGKVVNGFSMLAEQDHIFRQILGYIESEKPTAVLIAGDVYDRAVPSVEAVRLFDDLLTELAEKDITVLIISGNHDSPERLNYASRLLAERKLHLCGVFDGHLQSVTLADAYGEVNFWLLPFIKPSSMRIMFANKEVESYSDAINAALKSTDIDYSERNILLSHQFYTAAGISLTRSESEINPVGGLDAVEASLLTEFDYVALGHLHGAQSIGENIRYGGSPLKYSFSEWKQEKSVSLVEIKEKGELSVRLLPLKPRHDLREIKGSIEQLMHKGISLPDNRGDYLRIILTDEEEIIDPMGKLRSVYPNLAVLDFENSRAGNDLLGMPLDSGLVETLSPYDLFSEFFIEASGAVMSEEQALMVRELLEEGVDG